jgi:hypothetical protein
MLGTRLLAQTISAITAPQEKRNFWTSAAIRLSISGLLSAVFAAHAFAVPAAPACSDTSLQGAYASAVGGQLFHADGSVETRQGLVMSRFDGHGNFTQTDFVLNTLNGWTSPTPGPIDPQTGFQSHESGTYHVNPDCTGSMEIHFAPPPVPGATGAVIKLFLVIGSQDNALRMVVISVIPPSVIPNDISGFTLHSEGSKVVQLQQND